MAGFRPALSVAFATLFGCALLTGCTSDPAPSAVTIRWADDSHQAVRVSWKDSSAPNRVTIAGVVSTSPSYVKHLAAGAPNTWDIPTSVFPPDGNYRIAVAVGTSSGGITSKVALSPMFDTDGPVRPVDAQAQIIGRSVVVTWQVSPPSEDFTPADPLDVPTGRQLYLPVVGVPGQPLRPVGRGTTESRQELRNLQPPYLFQVRASNEWSSVTGAGISARSTSTTAEIPRLATFGRQLVIEGRTVQQEVSCSEAGCVAQRTTTAGLPVEMLAQDRPGAPWITAGRGATIAGGHFRIQVTTPATRTYRASTPIFSRVGMLSTPSRSGAVLTKSRIQVSAAGYEHGNVKRRNSEVTAVAVVRPAVNGRATVQYWTGKAWAGVKVVAIVRGKAAVTFRATRPGAFAYRFVIPGTAYLGRPVYGTTTPSLVLRVL